MSERGVQFSRQRYDSRTSRRDMVSCYCPGVTEAPRDQLARPAVRVEDVVRALAAGYCVLLGSGCFLLDRRRR